MLKFGTLRRSVGADSGIPIILRGLGEILREGNCSDSTKLESEAWKSIRRIISLLPFVSSLPLSRAHMLLPYAPILPLGLPHEIR